MPATLDISCPKCGKQLKVPSEFEGKRVKCKDCKEVFAVAAPKKNAPKGPKAAPSAPPPEETPKPPKNRFQDEDDDDGPAKPMGVVEESDVPRCPHCTEDLDPPDAAVCINCGFNNITRVKSETKKVIAANATEWTTHLLPGIIAAVIAIALLVADLICYLNMNDWLAGSFLEKEDKNAVTGATEFYVKPGAFTMGIMAISVFIIIPCTVFAVKRLIMNAKPVEKVKK